MASDILTRPITAEEFALMPPPPNGASQELVRGEIVDMAPAGVIHGVCCICVGHVIHQFVRGHKLGIVAGNDPGVITERNPDSVRGPDVAYWSNERLKDAPIGYTDVAPDLAVEVLSPSNTTRKIRDKMGELFGKGVRLIWIVSPEDRTLTIYRNLEEGRLLHEDAIVTGEDVLPGFQCKVSDLLP